MQSCSEADLHVLRWIIRIDRPICFRALQRRLQRLPEFSRLTEIGTMGSAHGLRLKALQAAFASGRQRWRSTAIARIRHRSKRASVLVLVIMLMLGKFLHRAQQVMPTNQTDQSLVIHDR